MVSKLVEEHGFTVQTEPLRWNVASVQSDKNVAQVRSFFPTDSRPFWILGNSFGNRVICEMLAAGQLLVNCLGCLFLGYPVYGEKNDAKRLDSLQRIPKGVKCLFISGSLDE